MKEIKKNYSLASLVDDIKEKEMKKAEYTF